ncbi:MAG TPA: DUF4307 domain-containing protein [Nocardioidaceae bacterium]|nr:DUF4307 domain-containing protein [Nocardioidaceae bacterium]
MTAQAPELAERYGAPSRVRRRLVAATAAVLAVALCSWLGWVMAFQGRPEVTSQLLGYDVQGQHRATATYRVVRSDADVRASCLLRAVSDDYTVVGERSVPVTSGPTTVRLTSAVRTVREAGSVQLLGCSTPDRPARR